MPAPHTLPGLAWPYRTQVGVESGGNVFQLLAGNAAPAEGEESL